MKSINTRKLHIRKYDIPSNQTHNLIQILKKKVKSDEFLLERKSRQITTWGATRQRGA